VATMPPTDRSPTASAPRTTSSGAPKVMAVCPARLDPDHDWRLVLAAMALQRRRSLQPMPHFVPPGKHDVPDSVLARTKGAVARAEASPPATRRPKAEDQVLGEADARIEVSPPAARRVNAPDC
jgi:hypothetical protein